MSNDLFVSDPESERRRRAAWALTILGLVAVIVVALMVFLLGTGNGNSGNNNAIPVGPTGPAVTVTSGPPHSSSSQSHSSSATQSTSSSARSSTSSSASSSTSTSASLGPATTSCPTSSPCTLAGDGGNVVAALNAYRTSHGQVAVPGSVSAQAQSCSLNNGDTSSCPTSYFWEPIAPQNGKAVVQKITNGGSGSSFVSAAGVTGFQIGWAYDPGSKQYFCTVVAVGA